MSFPARHHPPLTLSGVRSHSSSVYGTIGRGKNYLLTATEQGEMSYDGGSWTGTFAGRTVEPTAEVERFCAQYKGLLQRHHQVLSMLSPEKALQQRKISTLSAEDCTAEKVFKGSSDINQDPVLKSSAALIDAEILLLDHLSHSQYKDAVSPEFSELVINLKEAAQKCFTPDETSSEIQIQLRDSYLRQLRARASKVNKGNPTSQLEYSELVQSLSSPELNIKGIKDSGLCIAEQELYGHLSSNSTNLQEEDKVYPKLSRAFFKALNEARMPTSQKIAYIKSVELAFNQACTGNSGHSENLHPSINLKLHRTIDLLTLQHKLETELEDEQFYACLIESGSHPKLTKQTADPEQLCSRFNLYMDRHHQILSLTSPEQALKQRKAFKLTTDNYSPEQIKKYSETIQSNPDSSKATSLLTLENALLTHMAHTPSSADGSNEIKRLLSEHKKAVLECFPLSSEGPNKETALKARDTYLRQFRAKVSQQYKTNVNIPLTDYSLVKNNLLSYDPTPLGLNSSELTNAEWKLYSFLCQKNTSESVSEELDTLTQEYFQQLSKPEADMTLEQQAAFLDSSLAAFQQAYEGNATNTLSDFVILMELVHTG